MYIIAVLTVMTENTVMAATSKLFTLLSRWSVIISMAVMAMMAVRTVIDASVVELNERHERLFRTLLLSL